MKLILLPNFLSQDMKEDLLPPLKDKIKSLNGLIAESEKGARLFLRRYLTREEADLVKIALLNEHTAEKELYELIKPILQKQTWGIISDAGLPCLADPGSSLVALCRKQGVNVEAISGPSSIPLSLMLSGFSAQSFSFLGYLPREEDLLRKKIQKIERDAREATQIFIEAPYRNEKLFFHLLSCLNDATHLCVAIDLTSLSELVLVKTIREWKKEKLTFNKRAAIFLVSTKN
jgi:16S rRNA (cytidine1402-2'-O)-methyltransferase